MQQVSFFVFPSPLKICHWILTACTGQRSSRCKRVTVKPLTNGDTLRVLARGWQGNRPGVEKVVVYVKKRDILATSLIQHEVRGRLAGGGAANAPFHILSPRTL